MPTSFEPVKAIPATAELVANSGPNALPGPVTNSIALPGTPASTRISYSFNAENGASLVGLKTTVFPVINAPAIIPPASANGKLNGETTAHTPYGRRTLLLCSLLTT